MADQKERIDEYINELQHDILDFERIEDEWFYEISEQHSQRSWYGLESVNIDKITLEDESIIYLVNREYATELVEQSSDKDKVYDTLANPAHESGDEELLAIFDTEKEAYEFIGNNYPKIDVEKEAEAII